MATCLPRLWYLLRIRMMKRRRKIRKTIKWNEFVLNIILWGRAIMSRYQLFNLFPNLTRIESMLQDSKPLAFSHKSMTHSSKRRTNQNHFVDWNQFESTLKSRSPSPNSSAYRLSYKIQNDNLRIIMTICIISIGIKRRKGSWRSKEWEKKKNTIRKELQFNISKKKIRKTMMFKILWKE